MSIPTYFGNVRELLIGLSEKSVADKKELLNTASTAKILSAGSGTTTAAITIISGLLISKSCIFKCLFVLGAISTLAAREIYVIANNSEEILEQPATRGAAAANSTQFVNCLLKNTWVVQSIIGRWFIRQLNEPQK